ncbi:MAG: S-methyl-5-thioribose-1-phosphate isomerase [Elusimicrobia bacterium]|nr:S-methyl-5-thioribose-1-phosphate isomerase [Elusimicrobiota bacterium]
MLKVIEFKKNKLFLLDERYIPEKKQYFVAKNVRDVAFAIKNMVVRGAPLIGVTAAYGMALGYKNLQRSAKLLLNSRPTAVNLRWAVERILNLKEKNFKAILNEAKKIHREDKKLCEKIAKNGAKLIPEGAKIITHCNTGMLATAGIGTALGIILYARKKINLVYVKETRPRLQGSKLTAWELKENKIPYKIITDSTAAYLMKKEKIDACFVGADRISANGDFANKIGTYALAIEAKFHRVPFYVAAPYSTIDFKTKKGNDIKIEEREKSEVLYINGKSIAPKGADAINSAFDVTPNFLVTALITEKGILKHPDAKKLKKLYQGAT